MSHLSGASFLHLAISGGEKKEHTNVQKNCETGWPDYRRGCKI